MSSSDPRPPISKALPALAALLARMEEPSWLDLLECEDLGRSILPVPTLQMASLAVRLGMKRSAALYAMRTLDLVCGRAFRPAGRACAFEGVPVPVKVHSDTPASRLRGEFRVAMFDLTDLRTADFGMA